MQPDHYAPTVVITGASAGVGRATAIAFGQLGCNVGLLARDPEALEETKADVHTIGGQGLVLPADVAEPVAVEQAAERVEKELGPIDIWINCAMATVFSPFYEMTPDEYWRVTQVTYLGQVHGTMAALKHMRARDHGTIIQVGSALAYRGIPLQSAYCGAKFAIRGFTESLRSELIHEGSHIRLSMVQLPAVNTPQFEWARNRLPRHPQPVPPIFQPEPIAQGILYAAETTPRELWLGKSALQVILGSMTLPRILDRVMAKRAYAGQQTETPADPHRADNLFEPVSGKHRVHGPFDQRAKSRPLPVTQSSVRNTMLTSILGFLVGGFLSGFLLAKRG